MLLRLSPNSLLDCVVTVCSQRSSLEDLLATGAAVTVNLYFGMVDKLFVSQSSAITSLIIFYIYYIYY